MDESLFNQVADEMLARIEAALETALDASDTDFDYELKAGGVIELDFGSGGKIIINRHTAAREIWIAARSGGFHFKPESSSWVNTRDGTSLGKVLERCMVEQGGAPVNLNNL
jgi:CyaY protein